MSSVTRSVSSGKRLDPYHISPVSNGSGINQGLSNGVFTPQGRLTCILCGEEKNCWAFLGGDVLFLNNEHVCRACANHEGSLDLIRVAVENVKDHRQRTRSFSTGKSAPIASYPSTIMKNNLTPPPVTSRPITTVSSSRSETSTMPMIYRGIVGSGDRRSFNFHVVISGSDIFHIVVDDGFLQGQKYTNIADFRMTLAQNQFELSKVQMNVFDGQKWLSLATFLYKLGRAGMPAHTQESVISHNSPKISVSTAHMPTVFVPNSRASLSEAEPLSAAQYDPRLLMGQEWLQQRVGFPYLPPTFTPTNQTQLSNLALSKMMSQEYTHSRNRRATGAGMPPAYTLLSPMTANDPAAFAMYPGVKERVG